MADKTVLTEADLAAIRGLISDQVGTGMATLRSQLTKEFTAMSVHAGKWSTELEGKVEQTFRNLHSPRCTCPPLMAPSGQLVRRRPWPVGA